MNKTQHEASAEEIAQVEQEKVFWEPVAEAFGMRLLGWTYKEAATFVRGSTSLECPGFVARSVHALLERVKRGEEHNADANDDPQ